jgi:hypothetical protein
LIKFKVPSDKDLFIRELNEDDSTAYLVAQVMTEEPENTLDAQKYITAKRSNFATRLKDFRKSQTQKANWRSGRYKYLKGIREFTRSVEGKQFHRKLSQYLVTRGILKGPKHVNPLKASGNEDYNESLGMGRYDLPDFLVHLSSFRTHLMIETRYYQSLSDEVDYFLLLESVITKLNDLESRVLESMMSYNEFVPSEDDREFLEAIVGEIDHENIDKYIGNLFSKGIEE